MPVNTYKPIVYDESLDEERQKRFDSLENMSAESFVTMTDEFLTIWRQNDQSKEAGNNSMSKFDAHDAFLAKIPSDK